MCLTKCFISNDPDIPGHGWKIFDRDDRRKRLKPLYRNISINHYRIGEWYSDMADGYLPTYLGGNFNKYPKGFHIYGNIEDAQKVFKSILDYHPDATTQRS